MTPAELPVQVDARYGCWVWTGRTDKGYPVTDRGRTKWAHRAVYEQAVGAIPEGMQLDHLCRDVRCVRPQHLEPVTQRENLKRQQWSHRSARTHCPAGHDLFEHGRRTPTGGFACRRCCPEI